MLSEFILENRYYKSSVFFLRFWSYLHLIIFLVILFSVKKANPKFYLLNVYALYTSLSIFIIYQYYKIPKIFSLFLNSESTQKKELFEYFQLHKEVILKTYLQDKLARNYSDELLNLNQTELEELLRKENSEINWKLIGKIYFLIYILLSIGMYWILFTGSIYQEF
jgi:predicted neutral ceramidase superfamily lipid hydrolase